MDLEAAEEKMFFVNIVMVGEEEPADPVHGARKEWEEATRLEQGGPQVQGGCMPSQVQRELAESVEIWTCRKRRKVELRMNTEGRRSRDS